MAKKIEKPKGLCKDCEYHYNSFNLGADNQFILCSCIFTDVKKLLKYDGCDKFKKKI